jgi:hypothetical protein
MAVIIKKNEKIEKVIAELESNFTIDNFISKFKELYNKDWLKLEKTYAEHVNNTKSGKIQPMPNPEQYLKNALHVWQQSKK